MIPAEELRRRAGDLGVPESQIARDHLISHVLHALSRMLPQSFVFFGGTALCRTCCDDARLSEDIDLLVDDHVRAAESIPSGITRGIRRDFPQTTWVDLGSRHEVETRMLDGGGGVTLKMQLARWREGWRVLPVASTPVRLRYSDLPPEVNLVVPTPAAFAAMKLVAWSDRHAPRDLFDLHQLAVRGYFTPEVLELTRGLIGYPSSSATLGTWIPPATLESWNAELGQQTGDLSAPSACLQIVLKALDQLAPARE